MLSTVVPFESNPAMAGKRVIPPSALLEEMSDSWSGSRTVDRYAVFELLSNGHRHRLLTTLLEEGSTTAIPPSDDTGPEADPESVRLALYHIHLPKLDDAGLIEWDRDRNQVSKGPKFKTVVDLLGGLDETDSDRVDT